MKSLEESISNSMDGSEIRLIPYFPYIFQDIQEIGTSSDVILEIFQRNNQNYSKLRILDLGCGKGIIAIKLSREFGCICLGIDGIKEFIEEAKKLAKEFSVDELCHFQSGDIRKKIKTLPKYDIMILGAIGPVYGNYLSTLKVLSQKLNEGGKIIIDDSYVEWDGEYMDPRILSKRMIMQQIGESGMKLIDEIKMGEEFVKKLNSDLLKKIKSRCQELIGKYPDKRRWFEGYIKDQEEEIEILETKLINSTMLIGFE